MSTSASPHSPSPAATTPPSAVLLIVEDDFTSREMLAALLRRADFTVYTAVDGQEATEVVAARGADNIHALISDVQMPRLDGLGLLAWVSEHDATLATVMMTAHTERDLIAASLRGGAVEFIDKPFDPRSVTRVARAACETTRARRSARAAADRLRDIAQVHERLSHVTLPAPSPGDFAPALSLTTRFYPMNEAGGDLVKARLLPDGRFILILGDVSGHSIKEGFLAAFFHGIIEGLLRGGASLRHLAESFNRFLLDEWHKPDDPDVPVSLSVCFVELDFQGHRLTALNCGGPPVMLVDRHGHVTPLAAGGAPLGWFGEIEAALADAPLDPYGQVWLWSDGLDDHANLLKADPLALGHRILQAPAQSLRDSVLNSARDDIVIARLDWFPAGHAAPGTATTPFHTARYDGDTLPQIDHYYSTWDQQVKLALPHLDNETRGRVLLCCREAVLNALDHGCQGKAFRHCELLLLTDATGQLVRAVIRDDGPGFAVQTNPGRDDEEHISLGLRLMQGLAHKVQHSDGGRCLTLDFNLTLPPPAAQPGFFL